MRTRLLLVLLVASVTMSASMVQLQGGLEFKGTHVWKGSFSSLNMHSDNGFSLSGELLFPLEEQLLGGGIEYCTPRSTNLALSDKDRYSFLAPYVTFKYKLIDIWTVDLYIAGRLGVSIFMPSKEYLETIWGDHRKHGVGLHAALGTEFTIHQRFMIIVSYKIYGGSLSYAGTSCSVIQSNLSMMAGVRI